MPAKRTAFVPPTPDEVKAYAQSIGFPALDAEYFCDKHESVGWVTKNGVAIRDWKAVVRMWKRYDKNVGTVAAPQPAAPVRSPGEEASDMYLKEYASEITDIRSWFGEAICPFGDPRAAEKELWAKIYRNHGARFVERLKGRMK